MSTAAGLRYCPEMRTALLNCVTLQLRYYPEMWTALLTCVTGSVVSPPTNEQIDWSGTIGLLP